MASHTSTLGIHPARIALGIAILAGFLYTTPITYNYLADLRRGPQQEETPTEFINAATEDSIALDTIATLLESPNPDMAAAARRLVIERTLRHRHAYTTLLGNIRGEKGAQLQEQALVTLKFLYTQGHQLQKKEQAWASLVGAMRSFLPPSGDVRNFDPENEWKRRSQGERDGLYVLGCELDRQAVEIIRSTNLVRMWISGYPFGGHESSDRKRQDAVRKLCYGQSDDEELSRIMSALHRCPLGRKELRACKLLGSEIMEGNMDDENGSLEPPLFDDYSTNVRMPPESPRTRADPLESSEDADARLRRRRRNAMVFENGDEGDTGTPESEGPD